MINPVTATISAAAVVFLTYEVIFRAPEDYIRLKKSFRFAWVSLDEYVKEMKYPMKAYTVETSDGYILTVHRVPYGLKPSPPLECGGAGRPREERAADVVDQEHQRHDDSGGESANHEYPGRLFGFSMTTIRRKFKNHDTGFRENNCDRLPVVVIHGVLGCSGAMMVPDHNALAYVLAEGGFDTWLYNSRGTLYSRKHKKLNADKDAEYWEFSYQEMGHYDLQATVDAVLRITGCPRVIMIGYSMGNSVGVAFLADRPEYQGKVAQFFALAPAIYLNHMQSSAVEAIANVVDNIHGLAKVFKVNEVFSMTPMARWATAAICGTPGLRYPCKYLIRLAGGNSDDSMDDTKLVEMMRYVPAGVSLRTLEHLAQQLKNSKCFGKYDFGSEQNKEVYGREDAPCYDIGSITTPFCIYHGKKDSQVTVMDANRFADELPNVICNIGVPFNHFDFMWSKNGKELVYDDIVNKSNQISCGKNNDP